MGKARAAAKVVKMTRGKRVVWWILLPILIVLWFVPIDPTDLLDFGTPVLETIAIAFDLYMQFRKEK